MTSVTESALADVALVVLTDKDDNAYSFTTATQVNAKVRVKEGATTELIIKGVLKAQKINTDTVLGVDLEFQDNMFLPEVIQLLQGGTLTHASETENEVTGYTAPLVGSAFTPSKFNISIYTASYDTEGAITGYLKIDFPNGKGKPVELSFEDDKFFAPKYTIISTPSNGQAPYSITKVTTLPSIN